MVSIALKACSSNLTHSVYGSPNAGSFLRSSSCTVVHMSASRKLEIDSVANRIHPVKRRSRPK